MPPKDYRRQSFAGSPHCTSMANTDLVATVTQNVNYSTLSTTKRSGSVNTTALGKASPSQEKNDYCAMSAVWNSIKSTGISEESCKLIMSSWRSGTRKQYGTYIQQWIEFCDKQESDFLHPSVAKVLDFLTMLYKKGLSYTAVNTARSALSSLLSLPDGSTIGKHLLVSRLLKGIFQNRPPQPRYSTVWDVNTVLTHF